MPASNSEASKRHEANAATVESRRTRAHLWLAVALIALLQAVTVLAVAVTRDDGAYCPTEDSCVADYRDGEWHIDEVTP